MTATGEPVEPVEPAEPTGNGQARRRARTHAALVAAAQGLLVEGRPSASIEEITRRAGVGFGSFYNHFQTKEDLFAEAVFHVLDAYSAWLRAATAELDDPAEVFARSFRLTGRLARSAPDLLAPLVAQGTEVLLVERGLRDAALDDLRRGVASGRFVAIEPGVLLVTVGGGLLGLLRLIATDELAITDATIDAVAESVLRLLGVPADEAAELAGRPLPGLPERASWQ